MTVEALDGGAIWRAVFGTSRGNVLDAPLLDALAGAFRDAAAAQSLKAIVLEGRGDHFSYGVSIPEHLPPQAEAMLKRFHGALLAMVDSAVPVLAAVRGRCLGGGLELAALCHRVFAARGAQLGQPEIALGVFAPVASIVLVDRVRRGAAEDLCLSGRAIGAGEALAIGLVDQVVDGDPTEAAMAWAREHLLPKSASSLRYAVRALRADLRARLAANLPQTERLYLDDLMTTHDAVEGLTAFLERRPPSWQNR